LPDFDDADDFHCPEGFTNRGTTDIKPFCQFSFRRQFIPDFKLTAGDQADELFDDGLINALGADGIDIDFAAPVCKIKWSDHLTIS
jgi:hypothetical protein